LPRIALADSALAAPRAGFGDQDAYPDLIEKAAVLVEHLARSHPLPDGNKRAAFLSVWLFMEHTHVGTIERMYDVDLDARSDMHLETLLEREGVDSLNDLIHEE
jgi:hypothetical protein